MADLGAGKNGTEPKGRNSEAKKKGKDAKAKNILRKETKIRRVRAQDLASCEGTGHEAVFEALAYAGLPFSRSGDVLT